MLQEGNAALGTGDLQRATELYRAAIALAPRDPAGHVNLGYVLLEQGDAVGAEAALAEAVSLGGPADAHYLLGRAHAAQEQWDQARKSYREAVVLQPDFGFAWHALGIAWEHLGDAATALDAHGRAYRHAPELVDALGACARLEFDLGRHEQAAASARRWAQANPGEWAAQFIEGQALHALGRHGEALEALERALALAADNPAVLHIQGNILFALGRLEEAESSYARALAQMPDWIEPRMNRAVVLDRLARHEDAFVCLEQVLERKPDHALAHYLRPIVLMSLGRVPDALASVSRARTLHPQDADVEWHYAFAHLLAGRMRDGWPAYEARWRARSTGAKLTNAFRQPLWTGQPLQGKTLLVHPEQGLGDVLQFIRFVPALVERGAKVLVWVPRSLEELVATVSPQVDVSGQLESLPSFDYQCPIMSLPLALGIALDDLPGPVPYLHADPLRAREWADRLGERRGLRVGVVWSGNAAQQNDHHRSIPLAAFSKIATPGCEFVALQNVVRPEDQPAFDAWKELRFFGTELRTFADTAALAMQMDLVVSVCTSGAHLAGALGLPLWVLLSYRADWRWLLDREDSPWYPTARLFRQSASRRWEAVIERTREALAQRAAQASRNPASA